MLIERISGFTKRVAGILESKPVRDKGSAIAKKWEGIFPEDMKASFTAFQQAPSDLQLYLRFRCELVPLLLMNPDPAHALRHQLLLYFDLLFLLEEAAPSFPSPTELPARCEQAENRWFEAGKTIEPFSEEECAFVQLVPLPTDIYADSTGEAHALVSDIESYNRNPTEEKAREIIKKCFRFNTIDARDKERILSFLIQKPNLHPHLIVREQIGSTSKIGLSPDSETENTKQIDVEESKIRMLEMLATPSLEKRSEFPRVLFELVCPSLRLARGHYQQMLTVTGNIFTGKVTGHLDLIFWTKYIHPNIDTLSEAIWRELENGSLEIKASKEGVKEQLASDMLQLLISYGADEPLNFQAMDPHLFTLQGIEKFVSEHFTLLDGVDPSFLASLITQNLVEFIDSSKPMDMQVRGIGANRDGSVSDSNKDNTRFYQVILSGSNARQKEFEDRTNRYAAFSQGPMEAKMSAMEGVRPEVTAALLYGGNLNLSFSKPQLNQLLYQTMVTEVASDLLPHPLCQFSHQPKNRKQFSKVIVEGEERRIESPRGCYKANGEPVSYVIHPGTYEPVPFSSQGSESCTSVGKLCNPPFNQIEHRSAQHGAISGVTNYERRPFKARLQSDPSGKGQTVTRGNRKYELKGFIPTNLLSIILPTAHSCSSFVFQMLHAGYFATHADGFIKDMDAVRAQFLPKNPLEGYPVNLTAPYDQVRKEFQAHAMKLIESIWENSLTDAGTRLVYETEILPLILASKTGKRLSRMELCEIRKSSYLHCVQSGEEVEALGKLIEWFFPIPDEKTALEMKCLLTAAYDDLKKKELYQEALQKVRKKFDISPKQVSPALVIDLFERENMRVSLLPGYLSRLVKIMKRSLEVSRFDPYGFINEPSKIKGWAIDSGPKLLGIIRRLIQGAFTPVHLLSRAFLPKAHNWKVLKQTPRQVLPKRIAHAAEAPHSNWHSERIEPFEKSVYTNLCQVMEKKKSPEECYVSFRNSLPLEKFPLIASRIRQKLEKLHKWREHLDKAFTNRKKLDSALAPINFRNATSKTLLEGIAKGKTILKVDREKTMLFENSVHRAVCLRREIMLDLKTIFTEENDGLCDRAEEGSKETARNRMYHQMEQFYEDVNERRLCSFEEWRRESQIPESLKEGYEIFVHRFQTGNTIEGLIGSLNLLENKLVAHCPDLDPVSVLDYPIFLCFLKCIDHCVDVKNNQNARETLQKCFLNSTISKWTISLFSASAIDFYHFLNFLKGDNYRKKLDVLHDVMGLHPEMTQKPSESSLLIEYYRRGA